MNRLKTRLIGTVVASAFLFDGTAVAADYSARLSASPKEFSGKCPARIEFRGTIKAQKPGRVQYRFIRSDGANAPINTVEFDRPGRKRVTTNWTLGGSQLPSYNGWQAIEIVYPQNLKSNRARFRVRCAEGLKQVPIKPRIPAVRLKLPDLRVKIKGPQTAGAGTDIGSKIQVLVKNIGQAPAAGTASASANGYMVDVVLSKDSKMSGGQATYSDSFHDDVLLKGGRISNTRDLAAGTGQRYPTGGGIPADTPAGKYFLCARVDSGNKIKETNDNNNVSCDRIRITSAQAGGAAPAVPNEDCVGFNPATTTVSRINNRWKIVDGSHWIFDFRNKKAEADRSLAVIKRYRVNQSCFVGRPDPSFKYLLVSGRAPSGAMSGEDCVNFNPATSNVQRQGGQWKIVDGSHLMFAFGNKEQEARKALAIIKHHGFRKSCFVGRPDPSFTYLRK